MNCKKCDKKLSSEEIKEYGMFCYHCMVRFLSASFSKNKKDAQRVLDLSDKEVEEGMKRIANAMRQIMVTTKQFCDSMNLAFRALVKFEKANRQNN